MARQSVPRGLPEKWDIADEFRLQAKPTSIAAYTPKSISSDLVALLDHLGIPKVIVIGHDWGAAIAWRFCAFAPDRVKALIT